MSGLGEHFNTLSVELAWPPTLTTRHFILFEDLHDVIARPQLWRHGDHRRGDRIRSASAASFTSTPFYG